MATRYRVRLSATARSDVERIFAYIAETLSAPDAALNLMAEIDDKVLSLRDFPMKYALVPEPLFAHTGYRKIEVKNYLVFYRVNEDFVEVVRVLYGGQNYLQLLL